MFKKALNFTNLGLALILCFCLVAELHRFHGFLLIDLLIPLFTSTWVAIKVLKRESINVPPTLLPATLFFLLGLSSLLIHSSTMSFGELAPAAFYGVRWASFYFLSVIVCNQTHEEKCITLWMLFGFTLLLCLAGFIQLIIMPDFTSMENLGWDPHISRLLSTWFDPNFVGGFLAFILPIIGGLAWDEKPTRKFLLPLAIIVLTATALTLSRSAYLALIVGLFVFGLLRSVKLLGLMGLALIFMVVVLPPVQARFLSLVNSMDSFFVDHYTLPDASARLRFASWQEGLDLFLEDPLLGQGYNRYKYAALEIGAIKDLNIHSASGGDSSVLNILAMTGIMGFIPFVILYGLLAKRAWELRNTGYGAGFLSGLCGLFIHSIFVNSLLFPLFMAPFWISVGLLSAPTKKAPSFFLSPNFDR